MGSGSLPGIALHPSRAQPAALPRLVAWLALFGSVAAFAGDREYTLDYRVAFEPARSSARVELRTEPGAGRLVALDFAMPSKVYREVSGDGEIVRDGERVTWRPPRTGGALRYRVELQDRRDNGQFDSRITPRWVITRGDRLVPPARARATRGSESSARLRFDLPAGWDDVETPFTRTGPATFAVTNPQRDFDRPVGWIAAGDLVAMREPIAGIRVSVVAPRGEDIDHAGTLALLHRALPPMAEAFAASPEKLLVLRAGDPMWRGGLSAPDSFWLHAQRPLVSANGTSPLLHELAHVLSGVRGGGRDDWIGEGLAEYWSLEIARRAGLISDRRFARAIDAARRSGAGVDSLRAAESTRDRTRKAVALFAALDVELRAHGSDLDALMQRLARRETVTLAELRSEAAKLQGQPSQQLADVR